MKTAIVYYSLSGNTKYAAEKMAQALEADLIRLAVKNAENALFHHRESQQVKFARTTLAMEELQQALNLPALPRRIEGYDISNTQGVLSVAAMVVFEEGQPAKKEYRHFRIKTVEGPNDFASMYEVIHRRLTHGLTERKERMEAGLDLSLIHISEPTRP